MSNRTSMRFSLQIISFGLAAFVVFNTVSYYFLSTAFYKRLSQENQVYSETVALSISAFLEMAYGIGAELSQSQELNSMNADRQRSVLMDRFFQYEFFENFVIKSAPDGLTTAQVRGNTTTEQGTWWLSKVSREERPFISPAFYSFAGDAQKPITVIGMFFPVVQEEKVVAALAAILRADEIQKRVGWYYRGDERYIYVLDESGNVVVHPDAQQIREHYNYKEGQKAAVVRDTAGKPVVQAESYQLGYTRIELPQGLMRASNLALDGQQGDLEYQDLDGTQILCSYAPVRVPGYGASWAILTVQNKALALAPMKRNILQNALLSFLVLFALSIMLLRQSRTVDEKTKQLSESNRLLGNEVGERRKAETELTALNEELTAINEELVSVTDELHCRNEQLHGEVGVRRMTEETLRLRERQNQAIVGLLTDNTAALDTQMQTMLVAATQLAESADGNISLLQDGRLCLHYACGSHASFVGECFPDRQGMFPNMLKTGRLVYVEDYRHYPNHIQGEHWQNLSTAIMLPLRFEKRIIGGLTLTWANSIHPITQDEQSMLQQYADLAAIAYQAAHLRDNLRQELQEREALHEKISRLAFQDTLTKLANRAALTERLNEEMRLLGSQQRCGALFFIDLDDLKGVNDNWGHFAGDEVIVAAGNKLVRTMEGENVFIARLGGDEFIILLPSCNEREKLARVADRLIENLCEDYPVALTTVRISASIGITIYPQDGATVEEVLKNADNAMYAAKAAGRNCWRFFEKEMLREAQEKSALTNGLRHALDKRELSLVYQPQISLRDGGVVGYEALLRWHSEEYGDVSPAKFIPLAEQSGSIIPIGEWVLTQACQFIRTLTEQGGVSAKVAVNLSAHQLADEELVSRVARVLQTAEVAPERLELEITESALLPAPEESCTTLHALRALGVSLALDDFGTGFSSLTHLRLFPVETLKIDKSFLENVPGKDNAIVESLVRFAQSLKMKVIAEGVETAAQRDYLRECGCDVVQGYIYSPPVSETAALTFLTASGKGRASAGESCARGAAE